MEEFALRMDVIQLEPIGGENEQTAASICCAIANYKQQPVMSAFGGTDMVAMPGDDPKTVADDWAARWASDTIGMRRKL